MIFKDLNLLMNCIKEWGILHLKNKLVSAL